MENFKDLLLNPKLILPFFGGVVILAIIWNLFEHTTNVLSNNEKNNSVIILSLVAILFVISILFLI